MAQGYILMKTDEESLFIVKSNNTVFMNTASYIDATRKSHDEGLITKGCIVIHSN